MYRTRHTINYKGLADGDTQLIKAAVYNAKEMAKTCIEWGANLNLQNNLGNTALIEAASRGHDEIISILLTNGADLEIKNNRGNTAAMTAIRSGHKNTLTLLMKAGANIDIEAAITTAKHYGHLEVEIYLSNHVFAVENLIYYLQEKFIFHEETNDIANHPSSLRIDYNYLAMKCQKVGISDINSLLSEADLYLKEQNIIIIGDST